jgi:hypothetical protein
MIEVSFFDLSYFFTIKFFYYENFGEGLDFTN